MVFLWVPQVLMTSWTIVSHCPRSQLTKSGGSRPLDVVRLGPTYDQRWARKIQCERVLWEVILTPAAKFNHFLVTHHPRGNLCFSQAWVSVTF